jgi:hypothetical protein
LHVDHDYGLVDLSRAEILGLPGELAAAWGLCGTLGDYLVRRWSANFAAKELR